MGCRCLGEPLRSRCPSKRGQHEYPWRLGTNPCGFTTAPLGHIYEVPSKLGKYCLLYRSFGDARLSKFPMAWKLHAAPSQATMSYRAHRIATSFVEREDIKPRPPWARPQNTHHTRSSLRPNPWLLSAEQGAAGNRGRGQGRAKGRLAPGRCIGGARTP